VSWQFASPVQLVFGNGSLARLAEFAPWDSILVVTTPGAVRRKSIDRVLDQLSDRDVEVYSMATPGPQLEVLEEASKRLKQRNHQGIVGFGGGSAIDSSKAFSYLLNAPSQSLTQHFQGGKPLADVPLTPILAVQTAAGTGAEVTPFATIWDTVEQRKYSLGPPDIYPQTALLDPELTLSLPADLTLSACLDTLCQALESLWSRSANPVTTSFGLRSASIALEMIPRLMADLENLELRTRMLEASLLGGLAIASTKTTLAHSISYPITLRFGVLHGLACAFSIVQVVRFNAETDEGSLLGSARALGFDSIESLAICLEELLTSTGALHWLATLIPSKTDLLALGSQAITPGRADNNPRHVSVNDVQGIMAAAWDQASLGATMRLSQTPA